MSPAPQVGGPTMSSFRLVPRMEIARPRSAPAPASAPRRVHRPRRATRPAPRKPATAAPPRPSRSKTIIARLANGTSRCGLRYSAAAARACSRSRHWQLQRTAPLARSLMRIASTASGEAWLMSTNNAHQPEPRQRHELAIASASPARPGTHADHVDPGQRRQRAHHDQHASATLARRRPEMRDRIARPLLSAAALATRVSSSIQPTSTGKPAERLARIQIAAAGLIEIAGSLRVAQHQQAHRDAGQQHRPQAGRPAARRPPPAADRCRCR
ncbi:hypothetical protein RLIN73S_07275 [Rhodanobacter lindaniclasticus]